jgi:hypothetical protein
MAAARRPGEPVAPSADRSTDERRRRLKARNWALFAALVGFVVLIYIVAIVRMGGG